MQNAGNDDLSEFSRRDFTQRTCLDVVEVVMDDGEVISRREVSLDSVEDFGRLSKFGDENGKNCDGFDVKMICDGQNRFVAGVQKVESFQEGSIPARGNSNFEQVFDILQRKLPEQLNTSGTWMVVNGGNSVIKLPKIGQNNQVDAENGNSLINMKFPDYGQTSREESQNIRGTGSEVNFKLRENGQKGQTVDLENRVMCSRQPENGQAVDFRSDVNAMNLRQPKNGQKCQTIDVENGVVLNMRQPKNGQKCQTMDVENGVALNMRQPKNGQKCQTIDIENGVALNLGQPKNGQKCQTMVVENEMALNLGQPKNAQKCQTIDIENGVALNLRQPKNGQMDGLNGVFGGGFSLPSPIAEPQPKKCPSEGWGEARAVKEELFRGLGLVPRGVLHDNGRPVDRRHCVTGRRTVRADSELAESGPAEVAERPRNVFYPSGVPTMFDTEKFIGEIQRRPAIYDVRSKVYSNRVAKLKYWHEVGKEMYKGWEDLDQMERRSLVKELQIKWKSIRDHFMRQLKQNINGEGPKKKKYVHFDQLQFLTANLGVKRSWQPWKRNWDGDDAENSMSGSGCSRVKEEQDYLMQDPRGYPGPRHSYKLPKQEPEEEYMEFTPELPEERHFSFVTTVERADYDEREVPVAALLPTPQPEDLSYHKEPLYYHHQDLSYHKELEGDRMGNKMFLLSLLPIMERLPDHANIRARLQLMEVLQAFVAHEDAPRRDYYNHHNAIEKRDCDASQQHSTTSHSDSDS